MVWNLAVVPAGQGPGVAGDAQGGEGQLVHVPPRPDGLHGLVGAPETSSLEVGHVPIAGVVTRDHAAVLSDGVHILRRSEPVELVLLLPDIDPLDDDEDDGPDPEEDTDPAPG